jgi:hypothetical protein
VPTRVIVPHGIIQRIAIPIDLLRILRTGGCRALPRGRRRRIVRRGGQRARAGHERIRADTPPHTQASGVGGQGSGVGGQGSGVRDQGAGVVTLILPR